MDRLVFALGSDSCRNLLLALAHTLWQGVLAAGLLLLYLRRTPAQAANRRYLVGLAALAAIVLGGLLTWSLLSYKPRETRAAPAPAVATKAGIAPTEPATVAVLPTHAEEPSSPRVGPARAANSWQVWLLEAWLAGVVLMFLRLVAVVVGGGRLLRSCRLADDPGVLDLVQRLREEMGIGRKIRVLVGTRLATPGVIGCFWPTLLLPVSMVSGIPAEDLQAILAHELAHIRRYDYLVNFLQMVVEALLFFNPAVWWISRQIRIEREACCDAAGVRWTGQSVKYAKTLVAWAQRIAAPAPAIGFGKNADGGSTLDRLRRILVPGHQPHPRVPWHIATAMVVLTLACLVLIQQTASLAVDLAAHVLTPQERVDKIAALSGEYGHENREYGPEDKIEVSGVVRTWDIGPRTGPDRYGQMLLHSVRRASTSSTMTGVTLDGPFRHSVPYGRICVVASAEGYAPACAGPFEVKLGGTIQGIELVLAEGFSARIRTVDGAGQPVAGAQLGASYTYPDGASFSVMGKLITDANGIVTLHHAIARPITFQIDADGFESERAEGLVLSPGEIKSLTLKRTQPAVGVVLSQATGQPIAGAEVRIFLSVEGNQSYPDKDATRTPDAVTNADGRFELNRLRGSRKYLLFVRAPGYGYRYVPDVEAGHDVRVELGPKKTIRGTITGDLSLLERDGRSGAPTIAITDGYRGTDSSSYNYSRGGIPVTIRAGVGSFQIDDFWGQTVTLVVGPENVRLNVEEDCLDNIAIELRAPVQRQVVLRFRPPEGGPPVTGGVLVNYGSQGLSGQARWMAPKSLDIHDGQVTCEIPVSDEFQYSINFHRGKRPIGYWFYEAQPTVIPSGEGPYVIEVPVFPAGAVYGKILRPDGSVAERARAGLLRARKPDIQEEQALFLSDLSGALDDAVERGTFNATPLPLGSRYAVVAYEDYACAISDWSTLDEKRPLVNLDLRLPRGTDLEGRLLDSDGTPARNELTLHVSLQRGEQSWSMSGPPNRPDETGRFVFKNVNPGPHGTCSIEGSVPAGYRPLKHLIKNLRSPVIVQLEKGVGVTGTVIDDATGRPIAGAEVYATRLIASGARIGTDREVLNADGRTDAQGRFIFSNMARQPYQLTVGVAYFAPRAREPVVTGGQSTPAVVRVRIPAGSSLGLRDPNEGRR